MIGSLPARVLEELKPPVIFQLISLNECQYYQVSVHFKLWPFFHVYALPTLLLSLPLSLLFSSTFSTAWEEQSFMRLWPLKSGGDD